MITQKIPQNFKEAVDAIEEQLQASGDTAMIGMVICVFQLFCCLKKLFKNIFNNLLHFQ